MVIAPGLVYNVHQYSGMICQFVCDLKKKHKHSNMEVLAAGGRYDSMISWYRSIMEQANMLSRDVQQSAVGISISLDRLVQALQKEQVDFLDVVVCLVGTKHLIRDATKVDKFLIFLQFFWKIELVLVCYYFFVLNQVLRSLWAAGIRSSLMEAPNIEEIQEQLNELKVSHAIILKDNDQGTVRVRSWDKDR